MPNHLRGHSWATTTGKPVERIIAHVDWDACFASIEQQCNPLLRGIPIGVVRKPCTPRSGSVISAPSYEAKRMGVKTGMVTTQAWQICPSMRAILEDPYKYNYFSSQAFTALREFSNEVEVLSIDEAWIDLTQVTYQYYEGNALHVAQDIKALLHRRMGDWVTCSIGISTSKTMSKIAGEMQKPDGCVWIAQDMVQDVLEQLDVTEACGINKRIRLRLNRMGVYTLGQLGRAPIHRLRAEFGIIGLYLQWIGQGRDPSPVNPYALDANRKSYSHNRVIRYPYKSFDEAIPLLEVLCKKAAKSMRRDGKVGRVVSFWCTGAHEYRGGHKQMALRFPTNDEREMLDVCLRIAGRIHHLIPPKLDSIGFGITRLSDEHLQTIPLFEKDRQRQVLLRTLDNLHNRFGEKIIYPLSMHKIMQTVNYDAQNRGMHRDLKLA